MDVRLKLGLQGITAIGILIYGILPARSMPAVLNTNLQLRLVLNTTNSSGANSIRIRKDPRDNQLYYLKYNGDIYRLNLQPDNTGSSSVRVYSAADHGIKTSALGMTIGSDGTMY